MPPSICKLSIQPASFSFKTPFITAGGCKRFTHNLQLRLALSSGVTGLAEASTSIAMREQTPLKMAAAIRHSEALLRGRPIRDYRRLTTRVWQKIAETPTAAAAIECALWDAYAQSIDQPLWTLFGRCPRTIETDLTLSVAPPDHVAKAAQAAIRQGFRRLKVKLSGQARLDWTRLKAVQAVAPRARLVADGNQGFSLSEALDLDRRIRATGVRVYFFEQPFPRGATATLRQFRRQAKTPIVADESVRTAREAERLFKAKAIDGVNVKVAKSGLAETLRILQVARRHRGICSIGCMEESKLGLAASVHLACGTGVFDWVDLDSAHLLRDGRIPGGFHMDGPFLSVKGIGPGIGVR